jgi:hypothetical protein
MDVTGPLARLEADGLVRLDGDRPRTTARWQGALARAALRLLHGDAPWQDLRLPVAEALLQLCPELTDEELADLVETLVLIEQQS